MLLIMFMGSEVHDLPQKNAPVVLRRALRYEALSV